GWPDIYVANDSTPNFLFHNRRDGSFEEIALEAGVALSEEGRAQAGMGLAIADTDHDARMDIFVTNFSHDTSTLYRNTASGFRIDTEAAGLGEASRAYLGWGAAFADLDNDGWRDLLVANGHIYPEIDLFPLGSTYLQRLLLYRGAGSGRFAEVGEAMGGEITKKRGGRGVAAADYDNDGDVDILIVNLDARPTLLRNDGGNRKHWLSVQLAGAKSNRSAVGARVTVETKAAKQVAEVSAGGSYLSQHDPRLHFGLGDASHVARLEVRWPSGAVQKFENLAADRFLLIEEGKKLEQLRTQNSELTISQSNITNHKSEIIKSQIANHKPQITNSRSIPRRLRDFAA
ncbi:MAG: CRTAC1 family protein, partial [Candidatus Acidiferrales bacterium]